MINYIHAKYFESKPKLLAALVISSAGGMCNILNSIFCEKFLGVEVD
jgi:hypothetical protein